MSPAHEPPFAFPMTDTIDDDRWSSAWPDLVAFAAGLAAAWWGRWRTTDLVWSLWLSSLVVGYVMLAWGMIRPVIDVARAMSADVGILRAIAINGWRKNLGIALFALVAGSFVAGFFTVHFGGFHYVHSMLLQMFFPVLPRDGGRALAGIPLYREVARRYWIFLPSAFLAERAAFARRSPPPDPHPSVTAEAVAERKRAGRPTMFTEPYRKVVRMHFLIFFFFIAHFAGLENFAVYTVVYAAYFFPWRLMQARANARAAAPTTA